MDYLVLIAVVVLDFILIIGGWAMSDLCLPQHSGTCSGLLSIDDDLYNDLLERILALPQSAHTQVR